MKKEAIINFEEIKNFDFSIHYSETIPIKPYESNSHIHSECEIYINLSGDVSFMVENNIYPIFSGDIVITRPLEYHHCIYHSDKIHKHFWILFSSEGNEDFLDIFFKRKSGKNNLLILPEKQSEQLLEICNNLVENEDKSEFEKYNEFFKLINMLQSAETSENYTQNYYSDVIASIDYIDKNIENEITVKQLSLLTHVSINTLERHFKKTLNMTPKNYIRKKRLAHSIKLLSEGATVADAATKSGFSDFSSFITLFKKNYGATPLKYKKSLKKI